MIHPFQTIVCGVDLGPMTGRVLYHAAGLARVCGARLVVLHVASTESADLQTKVAAMCLDAVPYGVGIDERDVIVRVGDPATMIAEEAASQPDPLIVVGSSGHGRLAKLLLGSTTDALFVKIQSPMFVVPATGIDIVSAGDGAALTCGPVIAAVDLAEVNQRQITIASACAALAHSSLYLLTIAASQLTDHDAVAALKERGHHLEPQRPKAMIVRRGIVADEIARAAVSEGAGLVVMGLRERGRGRPGVIAASLLQTGRAFVLAVPATH